MRVECGKCRGTESEVQRLADETRQLKDEVTRLKEELVIRDSENAQLRDFVSSVADRGQSIM